MLVLSRKVEQQITIGGNITITILRVKGQVVSVGIEAPREIHILRSELQPKPCAVRTVTKARSYRTEGSGCDAAARKVTPCDMHGMFGRRARPAVLNPPRRNAQDPFAAPVADISAPLHAPVRLGPHSIAPIRSPR